MILSVCPDCYKNGKIVEGRFLNHVRQDFMYVCTMYHCDTCKKSYQERK